MVTIRLAATVQFLTKDSYSHCSCTETELEETQLLGFPKLIVAADAKAKAYVGD